MDPAKHVIPDGPVSGRLAGKPFTPDRVELEGNKLTFRQGKDFFADLAVEVQLPGDKLPAPGAKVVVTPKQSWTEGNLPQLTTGVRTGDGLPKMEFVNDKYALTLELGKKDQGKVPGKVYLALPDAQKSYLAGAFTAEVVRGLTDPAGPDDAPYIRGTVAHPGAKGQMLWVSYTGLTADGKVVSDGVGSQTDGGAARSMTNKPRAATLNPGKNPAAFDFTKLPPGRYLVAARLKDGPSAWAWVEVKPGGTPSAELKLDPAKVGTVEVKLPAGAKERVVLTPADPDAEKAGLEYVNSVSFVLDYSAEPKDGKATIPNVAPGAYTVRFWSGGKEHNTTVTVEPGKTAAAEIKPAAKK
jgi:hypothetical protein